MKAKIEIDFGTYEPSESDISSELSRLAEMVEDGFTSGEIITNDDDKTFRGWWSLSTE